MFGSVTHLTVRRPSPTTVSYSVSNASKGEGAASRLLYLANGLTRCCVFCAIVLGLYAKVYCFHLQNSCISWLRWVPTQVKTNLLTSSWEIVFPVVALALFLCFNRFYTEENLLVLSGLGIQTSTSSSTYLSSSTTRFIPTSQIQDIFIHEAFKGFEVRYYLAIVVKGEKEVTVVFPILLPNLSIVEQVWRGTRKCLFDISR